MAGERVAHVEPDRYIRIAKGSGARWWAGKGPVVWPASISALAFTLLLSYLLGTRAVLL